MGLEIPCMLGYCGDSKVYRLCDVKTNEMVKVHDVVFFEDSFEHFQNE